MPSIFGYNRLATDEAFKRQFLGDAVGVHATLPGYRVVRFIGPYPTIQQSEDSSVSGLLFKDVPDADLRCLDRTAKSDGMTRQKFEVTAEGEKITAYAYVLDGSNLLVRRGVPKPVQPSGPHSGPR